MRLLSSEAKDWKSRVVTEAEEVLCRESAQIPQQATETQEAMDQHYKARWQQAEADLKALCQSNSAQLQSRASKLRETNEEHQQLHTAQERYASRHKPYEKHNSANSKQRSQLRSVRIWSRNSDVKQMNNRIFGSSYGRVSFLSSPRTGQRSMSSILRCST